MQTNIVRRGHNNKAVRAHISHCERVLQGWLVWVLWMVVNLDNCHVLKGQIIQMTMTRILNGSIWFCPGVYDPNKVKDDSLIVGIVCCCLFFIFK